jgi:hypothetical protein
LKEYFFNKRGHLDTRNVLSIWSVIKEAGDIIFVLLGANKFYEVPIKDNELLFAFWVYSIIKMVVDFPLCLSYLIGKWQHIQRVHRSRKRRKNEQKTNI